MFGAPRYSDTRRSSAVASQGRTSHIRTAAIIHRKPPSGPTSPPPRDTVRHLKETGMYISRDSLASASDNGDTRRNSMKKQRSMLLNSKVSTLREVLPMRTSATADVSMGQLSVIGGAVDETMSYSDLISLRGAPRLPGSGMRTDKKTRMVQLIAVRKSFDAWYALAQAVTVSRPVRVPLTTPPPPLPRLSPQPPQQSLVEPPLHAHQVPLTAVLDADPCQPYILQEDHNVPIDMGDDASLDEHASSVSSVSFDFAAEDNVSCDVKVVTAVDGRLGAIAPALDQTNALTSDSSTMSWLQAQRLESDVSLVQYKRAFFMWRGRSQHSGTLHAIADDQAMRRACYRGLVGLAMHVARRRIARRREDIGLEQRGAVLCRDVFLGLVDNVNVCRYDVGLLSRADQIFCAAAKARGVSAMYIYRQRFKPSITDEEMIQTLSISRGHKAFRIGLLPYLQTSRAWSILMRHKLVQKKVALLNLEAYTGFCRYKKVSYFKRWLRQHSQQRKDEDDLGSAMRESPYPYISDIDLWTEGGGALSRPISLRNGRLTLEQLHIPTPRLKIFSPTGLCESPYTIPYQRQTNGWPDVSTRRGRMSFVAALTRDGVLYRLMSKWVQRWVVHISNNIFFRKLSQDADIACDRHHLRHGWKTLLTSLRSSRRRWIQETRFGEAAYKRHLFSEFVNMIHYSQTCFTRSDRRHRRAVKYHRRRCLALCVRHWARRKRQADRTLLATAALNRTSIRLLREAEKAQHRQRMLAIKFRRIRRYRLYKLFTSWLRLSDALLLYRVSSMKRGIMKLRVGAVLRLSEAALCEVAHSHFVLQCLRRGLSSLLLKPVLQAQTHTGPTLCVRAVPPPPPPRINNSPAAKPPPPPRPPPMNKEDQPSPKENVNPIGEKITSLMDIADLEVSFMPPPPSAEMAELYNALYAPPAPRPPPPPPLAARGKQSSQSPNVDIESADKCGSAVSERKKFFEERALIQSNSRSPMRKTQNEFNDVAGQECLPNHGPVAPSPPLPQRSRKGSLLAQLFGSVDVPPTAAEGPVDDTAIDALSLSEYFENRPFTQLEPLRSDEASSPLKRSMTMAVSTEAYQKPALTELHRWKSSPKIIVVDENVKPTTKPFRRASLVGRRRNSISFYSKDSSPDMSSPPKNVEEVNQFNSFCSFDTIAEEDTSAVKTIAQSEDGTGRSLYRDDTMYGYL